MKVLVLVGVLFGEGFHCVLCDAFHRCLVGDRARENTSYPVDRLIEIGIECIVEFLHGLDRLVDVLLDRSEDRVRRRRRRHSHGNREAIIQQ